MPALAEAHTRYTHMHTALEAVSPLSDHKEPETKRSWVWCTEVRPNILPALVGLLGPSFEIRYLGTNACLVCS